MGVRFGSLAGYDISTLSVRFYLPWVESNYRHEDFRSGIRLKQDKVPARPGYIIRQAS